MGDYFDINNEELLKDFFSEAEQQVETLESNILVLENEPSNTEAMDEIFRAAHTLKGGSATVEMTELAGFTHGVEDLLDALRSDTIKVTEDIVDMLLLSIDVIKAMLEERAAGRVYEEDVEPLKARLHASIPQKEKKSSKGKAPKPVAVPKPVVAPAVVESAKNEPVDALPSPATLLSEYDILELQELCSNKSLVGVTVLFDKEKQIADSGLQIFTALNKDSDVLKTIPEFDIMHEKFHDKVVYFIATTASPSALEDIAFIDELVYAVDAQIINDIPVKQDASVAVMNSDENTTIPSSFPHPETYLTNDEIDDLHAMCASGEKLYGVTVFFDEDNPMNSVGAIQSYVALKEKGTVVKSIPDFEDLYDEEFYETVIYYVTTTANIDALEDAAFLDDAVLAVDAKEIVSKSDVILPVKEVEPVAIVDAPVVAEMPVAAEPVKNAVAKKTETAKKPAAATGSSSSGGSVLRVDSKRIDYLLNLVSETVITKAAFNQTLTLSSKLQNDFQLLNDDYKDRVRKLLDQFPLYVEKVASGMNVKEAKAAINEEFGDIYFEFDDFENQFKVFEDKFRSYTQVLGRVSGELQEGVMKIRMVPISQIFSRFPRVVRDLTRELGKKIDLVIEGEETELDKSVVEDLLDPIMHCVRNSMDHGIELPADREKIGKNPEGTLLLRASNEGNMIVIEIRDDGKGIDVDKVREKAIERGLIHANRVITDEEAFQFIFDPGFSTAKEITSLSGRGVGLDVVKTQIEKLKGSVVVDSQKDVGTTFTIKIPLTLAIIQGLLVRVGEEVYSIPIAAVIESQRINIKDLRSIDNYEVMTVRDEVISVLRLNRLFNIKAKEDTDTAFIVIVGSADKKIGVMVDSLISEEDIVIKPLTDQFVCTPGIAGASILGDGSVSLIIDVSQLLGLGIKQELSAREEKSNMN